MPLVRRVIKYSGMDFEKAVQLPCDMFLLMAKNQYIEELNSTEEGREYLQKCKRLSTAEIDLEGLNEIKKEVDKHG